MANNQVSVEITLEEKAALKALTQLTKEIQKTEMGFTKLGASGDSGVKKIDKATKELMSTFSLATLPFKKIEEQSKFSLRKVDEDFTRLNKTTNEFLGTTGQLTTGVSNGFKSLIGGVTIANLASSAIIGVANEIKSFIVGSVNAAVEQENAINRLNQALKSSGDFSSAASQDLLSFATNLQKVSVFGDEVVVGQLAVAKAFGASNAQAKQLVEAAANLSATFGGSLESNVEKLGKTFSGEAGRLAQYIPALKDLTSEQLKSGAAFEIVNSKFSGAAANELNTYSGQVTSMANAYSDLQEELGAFVTQSTSVSGATGILKGIFESATQALVDFRIELQRGDNGFIENADSLNQLSREYAGLTEQIEGLEKKETLLPGGLDSFDTSKLKAFRNELSALETQIKNASTEVLVTERKETMGATGGEKEAGGISPVDQKLIDSRQAAYAQLEIARADFNAKQIEQSVLEQEITAENSAFELERLMSAEQMKIDAIFAAEEQKAALITDAKTKQFTLQKLAVDKEAALQKSAMDTRKKLDTQQVALEQQKQAAIAGLIGSGFTLLATLAKDGSREQFLIQKAAAVAEIAIADGKARALIPAQTAMIPFPGNLAAAATLNGYVSAQTAIGLATVAAATIKGYENGGVIPGGSYTGDNVMARVNSGEMILNRQQQAELFNLANGAKSGGDSDSIKQLAAAIASQPINLTVDGRVLATVIRGEVRGGFKLN